MLLYSLPDSDRTFTSSPLGEPRPVVGLAFRICDCWNFASLGTRLARGQGHSSLRESDLAKRKAKPIDDCSTTASLFSVRFSGKYRLPVREASTCMLQSCVAEVLHCTAEPPDVYHPTRKAVTVVPTTSSKVNATYNVKQPGQDIKTI